MNIFNLFKKQDESSDEIELDTDNNLDEEQQEGVAVGTKVKVVSALAVVGIAMSVAYWVQEPEQTPGTVLSATNERSAEESDAEVAADTLQNLVAATESVTAKDFSIDIVDFTYSPANIEVSPGTEITWTNMDQVAHTVTGDDFSSSSLKAGESFSYTFDLPGSYEYYCAFHPQMLGTITVVGTASATEADSAATLDEEVSATDSTTGAMDDPVTTSSPDAIDATADLNAAASDSLSDDSVAADSTDVVTMDANQFVNNIDSSATMTPDELSTTGPEEMIYFALAIFAFYINRRKLAAVFKK